MHYIRPVILCGGSGTRLWPLSRWHYPKQFMELEQGTLFGQTLLRSKQIPHCGQPIVVCNEEHRFYAAGILQELGIKAQIILEPQGRNTAPAIALAALAANSEDLLLILPSDHQLEPVSKFIAAVEAAIPLALTGKLGTFGLQPTHAETGYGYIEAGALANIQNEVTASLSINTSFNQNPNLTQNINAHGGVCEFSNQANNNPKPSRSQVFEIARFIEKPDLAKAQAMQEQGNFLWNSGMFLFTAQAYLAELKQHVPEIYTHCKESYAKHTEDLDFIRPEATAFSAAPAISIDYAVMEKTQQGFVVTLAAQWNDLGSFEAFYETSPHDAKGNALSGDVLAIDSHNCYLHSTKRLVATLGVHDLVVVETADAILVTKRDESQNVKKLLQLLLDQGRPEAKTHAKVFRPWGTYETISRSQRFQVKRIIVKPGAALSLQLHHHRAEHWVIVAGTAKVNIGDKERMLTEDQSVYIPLGTKHRLENPGCINLELIEVQSGAYLGEDDIVRFADVYGRIPQNQECS